MRNIFAIFLFVFCLSFAANAGEGDVVETVVQNAVDSAKGGLPSANKAPVYTMNEPFGKVKSLEQVCGTGVDGNAFSLAPDQDLKFISVAVPCIENVLLSIADDAIKGFTQSLSNVIGIALTLYLIFFGVKISTGLTNEQRLKSETIVHAIKISFVTWLIFLGGNTDFFRLTMEILYGFIEIVMAPVAIGKCTIDAPKTQLVWNAMDCVFNEFIGWNAPNPYSSDGWKGTPLLFAFATASFTSGSFGGMLIGGIILTTLFTLITAFFRVAFAYILSILTLILLFTISPIMIPMMLFPATKEFFDGWWKMIISMVIQPVIIFAFMAFILSVMNEIVVGDEGLTSVTKLLSTDGTTSSIDPAKAVSKGMGQIFENANMGFSNLYTNKMGDDNSVIKAFTIDFQGSGLKGLDEELLFNLISMLLVAYLLMSFAKIVGTIGQELSGSFLTPNVGDSSLMKGVK